jgi:arginyl-tRNA synthetase
MNFKEEICKILFNNLENMSEIEIFQDIEIPPSSSMGNFAFPCFRLSKQYKKSPQTIANELSSKIIKPNWISHVTVENAYVNFFIEKTVFAKQIITSILEEKEDYGKQNIGNGKSIVIDYSSPNIAKPFHVGHLRSTVIGNALYNTFNHIGYKCVGINHLGDWGTQFGKLIVAYKMWGNKEEVDRLGIEELTRIYVKFHCEAEKDESLNETARGWLIKMQENNEEALSLWKWFNDISLIEFNRIYEMLGIRFDSYCGESFYTDKMPPVVEELKQKNILIESNGAMIVDLEQYDMPPCLILRKDGGTLYPTRDIAAAIYRKETYDFEKCIIITAMDQSLHFAQFFKVIELMGKEWAKDLVHIPFGLVRFADSKLSTRKGNIVLMEDLLNLSIKTTMEIIENKNPNLTNKEQVAKDVGVGAIIFNDLFNSRIKDVIISFEKILNFEAQTGPYVQYTHARTCSLIAKSSELIDANVDFSLLEDEFSMDVIKSLASFGDKLVDVATKYEPYILSRYLVDLCKTFNKFYNNNPILTSEENLKIARLSLVACVRYVLKSGLSILGIAAPEQM